MFRNFRNRIGSYGGGPASESDEDDLAKAVSEVRNAGKGSKDDPAPSRGGSIAPSRGGSIAPGKDGPSREGSFFPGREELGPSRGASFLPGEVVPSSPSGPPPTQRSAKKKSTIKDALGRLMGKRKPESIANAVSPASSLNPDGSGLGDLGQADRQRFIDKVETSKSVQLQKEIQQIMSNSPGVTREELIGFRDVILEEAWSVICNGFLKMEYTRFTEVETRHKKMLKESRDTQTAYLREITALKDQLRTLPDGAARFCDITHFDPMKCIDEDVRPLVEAAVQERMKQCISQAHGADSELNNIVCKFMAKEREEWVARGEAAEEEAAQLRKEFLSLEAEAKATESIIDRERHDAAEVKKALDTCQQERDELLNQLSEMKELEAEVEKLRKASATQVQELQDLRQQKAQQESLVQEWETGKRRSKVAEDDKVEDQVCPSPSPPSTAASGSRPGTSVQVSGDFSAMQLLGQIGELQDKMQTSPEACVELHKVLESLSSKLDADCLEAAYRCKPKATAASIELLAQRVRTSRKEAALARRCCVALAEALASHTGEAAALAEHQELLEESTSVATQSMGSLEEPKRRAIQAAVAILSAAAEDRAATPSKGPSKGEKNSPLPALKEVKEFKELNESSVEHSQEAPQAPKRTSASGAKASTLNARRRSTTQPLPSISLATAEPPQPSDSISPPPPSSAPSAAPSLRETPEPSFFVEGGKSGNKHLRQLHARSITPSDLATVRPGGVKSKPGGGTFVIPKKG
eukprot:gb/GFBE01030049.1/.p1 GENE.gb/GFBE01030049.1/~~gb/GFBE01030049.1/.p1  ORF type:complete len:755 (+),score=157.47 gb/GFBE01030049.1/:1-2265(+)